jgi:hypothetical protein
VNSQQGLVLLIYGCSIRTGPGNLSNLFARQRGFDLFK